MVLKLLLGVGGINLIYNFKPNVVSKILKYVY